MQSFAYDYPVRNYFGEGAVDWALDVELDVMGKTVLLAYGGGSVKRTGVYDHVVEKLRAAGKRIVDFGGIMSNPTYEKCQEGAALARAEQVDFILAVGGGSVFDCCKVVSAQACLDEDIEQYEHADGRMPTEFIPMACIVTLSGTGAEQNDGAVITNEETHVKGPFAGALPRWAALDPALTLTVPHMQFMSGAYDTLSHCMESYFGTPREANVTDDINLAIQRNVIRSMRAVAEDDQDLAARSELVYDSAMAENGVLKVPRGDPPGALPPPGARGARAVCPLGARSLERGREGRPCRGHGGHRRARRVHSGDGAADHVFRARRRCLRRDAARRGGHVPPHARLRQAAEPRRGLPDPDRVPVGRSFSPCRLATTLID